MDEEFKKLNEIWSDIYNELGQEEIEKIIDKLIVVDLKTRGGVGCGEAACRGQS